jgi:hypothetical protein
MAVSVCNGVEKGGQHYFVITLFEHAVTIKIKSNSGDVREDWIREPYGGDSSELESLEVISDGMDGTVRDRPKDPSCTG